MWKTLFLSPIASIMMISFANASWSDYETRYRLNTPTERLTDHSGGGFPALHGTKNFRQVLLGVLYRGGGNNKPRDNRNPLPNHALKNLCEEGFDKVVYLYTRNFQTAPKSVQCNGRAGANQLGYVHHSHLDSQGIEAILRLVHSHLLSPEKGPIYVHCWNGWHATGIVAANALQQFCGWSGEKALQYWHSTIDGADSHTPAYAGARRRVRDFRRLPGLTIPADVQAQVCPR